MGRRHWDSLAGQIQGEVVDSSVAVSDILRKAKVLASLLRNAEFRLWVDTELKGYESDQEVPDYRSFQPLNLGTFSGVAGRMFKNVQIPVSSLPDNVRKFAEQMIILQSVKEIETTIGIVEGAEVTVPWPPEAVILARDHVPMTDGSKLVEAWKPLTKGQMESVLDQVRNRLLDFLLELQQIDPDVRQSEEAIRSFPNDRVQNVFNTTIMGGQNVIATGTEFSQKVSQGVSQGNAQSLCDHLRSLGIQEDALAELRAALAQEWRTTATGTRRRREVVARKNGRQSGRWHLERGNEHRLRLAESCSLRLLRVELIRTGATHRELRSRPAAGSAAGTLRKNDGRAGFSTARIESHCERVGAPMAD